MCPYLSLDVVRNAMAPQPHDSGQTFDDVLSILYSMLRTFHPLKHALENYVTLRLQLLARFSQAMLKEDMSSQPWKSSKENQV